MAKLVNNRLDIGGFPGTFTLSQDAVVVWSGMPERDTDWKYTDEAGHVHSYWDVPGDPYLSLRKDIERVWCGEHGEYEEIAHYFCKVCGEEIIPGTRLPEPKSIPGVLSGQAEVTIPPGVEAPRDIEFEHEGKVYDLELVSISLEAGLPAHAVYVVTDMKE